MEEERKRIHIFVPEYLHKQIRVYAAEKGLTITEVIIIAVLEQFQRNKSIPTQQ